MLKNWNDLQKGLISETHFNQSLQSYFGILGHCRGFGIKKKIEEMIYEKAK